MALVVSDWDEGFLEGFIDSLNHDQHPFHEVVVMRPQHAARVSRAQLVHAASFGITVRFVEREFPDYMDWCEAPVESEWFMYVNTYFKVRKYVDILLTEEDKPLVSCVLHAMCWDVITKITVNNLSLSSSNKKKHFLHTYITNVQLSYIYSDLPFCQNYESCRFAVSRAQSFDPDADKHVQDFEMVINTDERDQFCSVWKGLNMPPPSDPCVPQGPTATAFLAYLNSKHKAKKLYKLKDKAQFGWRSAFRHVHDSLYIDQCSEGRRLAATNETVCRDIEDPILCEEEPNCEYDYQFLTCFESGSILPTPSPTVSPPPTITPSPTAIHTELPTPAPTGETVPFPSPTVVPSARPTSEPSATFSPTTETHHPSYSPTVSPTTSNLQCLDPAIFNSTTNITCNEPLVRDCIAVVLCFCVSVFQTSLSRFYTHI
jgi:hypothetical protein